MLTRPVDPVPAPGGPASPPTVLVVEDDLKFADLLTRAFAGRGMTTVHCATGDEALRTLQSGVRLCAAVLDVMIPHPDGLEVCRDLRRRDPHVPVIAVSARAGSEHRARALAAGADSFLEKPFGLGDLVSLTTTLIARSREGNQ